MDGPLLCRGHFSCISQEFGSHCPSPWLFFSALVERRTSQYESEQTCRRQEAAGAIQKCKRWSWTVYSICDAYDAEHVFHSCFRRGYHLDEGECDHAGCVYANPQHQHHCRSCYGGRWRASMRWFSWMPSTTMSAAKGRS